MMIYIGNILSYDNLHSRHIVGLSNFWYQIFCYQKSTLHKKRLDRNFHFSHPPTILPLIYGRKSNWLWSTFGSLERGENLREWKKLRQKVIPSVNLHLPRLTSVTERWFEASWGMQQGHSSWNRVQSSPQSLKILSNDDLHRKYPLLWYIT